MLGLRKRTGLGKRPGLYTVPPAAMQPSIHSLPEDVQGRILELAGQQVGPAATLVCKRWYRLFYQQPSLWRQFTVRAPAAQQHGSEDEWWQRKLALLLRIRSLVTAAHFESLPFTLGEAPQQDRQLPEFIAALDPAALTSLTFIDRQTWVPSAAVGAIAACTRLQALNLRGILSPLREEDVAVLQHIGNLRQLKLAAFLLAPTLFRGPVASLLQLLTSLTLDSALGLQPTQPLIALAGLQQLHLSEVTSQGDGRQLLPVTAFPALKRMTIQAPRVQVPGGILVHSDRAQCLFVDLQHPDDSYPGWYLMLLGAAFSSATPLAAVLRAFGLESVTLASVQMSTCKVQTTGLSTGNLASKATDLIINNLTASEDVQLGVVLDELLGGMPSLNLVSISGCDLSQGLSNSLIQCSTLETIICSNCNLIALPAGPYLQGLRGLSLPDNKLSGALPRSLTTAHQLHSLDLRNNPLVLSWRDAMRISHLPQLRFLELSPSAFGGGAAVLLAANAPQLGIPFLKSMPRNWHIARVFDIFNFIVIVQWMLLLVRLATWHALLPIGPSEGFFGMTTLLATLFITVLSIFHSLDKIFSQGAYFRWLFPF